MTRVYLCFAVTLSSFFGASLWCAEPQWNVFASPSGEGASGFRRLTGEESGLEVASEYRDPRAWGERLHPATVGTVGTGVGSGDFNGDGYPDLFVAMREGRNRLYLNVEGRRFIDRTEEAGILESLDWSTGVTVVDLNGDALPDIYVCFFDAPNRLYLNQGGAVFKEVAGELGLAVRDSSSGAFFADYDRDGDLDLYLQTNVRDASEDGGRPDYFLRNNGAAGFVDVTEEIGIRYGKDGATLGHSVLWVDYDGDGWEDLYVANDFRAPDFLYLNNGDGGFRPASERIPVAPYSSMGSDVGDVNGDGRIDILTTDMATPSYTKHVESMLTSAVKTRDLDPSERPPQTMKNALLLNRGRGDYVDVGYAWNLAATDWTWAPRLVDLDNDGWLDAFFTNGMIRQFHNADLALEQDRQTTLAAKTAVFKRSPVLREENLVFRNADGQGFEAANKRWGFEHEGVSFGAALLDFDRDGDLDVVYTNFEEPPTLWRNDLGTGDAVHVRLVGAGQNTQAIGAVAVARFAGRVQAQKILSNRGYLGSDEKLLHFGLPAGESGIERLEIHWPDGERQEALGLEAGKRYVIEQRSASVGEPPETRAAPARFTRQEVEEGTAFATAVNRPVKQGGLLYPFKPVPGAPKPKMIREDFDGDGRGDVLILRDWAAPRLILSGSGSMTDASDEWGVAELSGLWSVAIAEDFNADGRPDALLGGMGINDEISYRSEGEGRLIRRLGRFSPDGPLVNLNAYQWGDELRLFDGLRDYAEFAPGILPLVPSFRETGELDPESFIERVGFELEETYEIDRFRTGILLNQKDGGFRFEPLPLEAQYGRVWDAATTDLDGDGASDVILLLGQISPHSRSSQPEDSFVSVFFGKANGSFTSDDRPPLDQAPSGRVVGLRVTEERGENVLHLLMEDGRRILYNVAKDGDN